MSLSPFQNNKKTPASHAPVVLQGLKDIHHHFSCFLVDLFGVVHDGQTLFPKAKQCLESLKASGKTVILFTNAPRLPMSIEKGLLKLGLDRTLYSQIVSSGEHVCETLQIHKKTLGTFYFHVGSAAHQIVESHLGYQKVTQIEKSDFILLTGLDDHFSGPEEYKKVWQYGIENKLPLVCANSDPYVISAGKKVVCAGALATLYEERGGRVYWHGKPQSSFYTMVLKRLNIPLKQVCAIGDSMWTDIEGAERVGISHVLITNTGVHGAHFLHNPQGATDFWKNFSLKPCYLLKTFLW